MQASGLARLTASSPRRERTPPAASWRWRSSSTPSPASCRARMWSRARLPSSRLVSRRTMPLPSGTRMVWRLFPMERGEFFYPTFLPRLLVFKYLANLQPKIFVSNQSCSIRSFTKEREIVFNLYLLCMCFNLVESVILSYFAFLYFVIFVPVMFDFQIPPCLILFNFNHPTT